MAIIYRMKVINASKKRFRSGLDCSRVLSLLICSNLIFSETLSALPLKNSTSGAIFEQAGSKTTFFFSLASDRAPSYLVRSTNGDYMVVLKRAGDAYRFRIRKGVITDAVVQKPVKNSLAIASYSLQGTHYRLKKLVVTNRFRFSADGSCSTDSAAATNIKAIGEAVDLFGDDVTVDQKFVGDTCSRLKGQNKAPLEDLIHYFEPENSEKNNYSGKLLACLKDYKKLESNAKDLKLSQILNSSDPATTIKAAAEEVTIALKGAIAKHSAEKNGVKLSPIQVECKKNPDSKSKNPAEYDTTSGKINFFVISRTESPNEEHLLANLDVGRVFFHEYVHLSLDQPIQCSKALSEDLANLISKTCIGESSKGLAPGEGMGVVADTALTPAPSIATIAAVQSKTAIAIDQAVAIIPPQSVPDDSNRFLGDVPSSQSPSRVASNAVNEVYYGSTTSFGGVTERVAEMVMPLVIPPAEAQSAGRVSNASRQIVEDTLTPSSNGYVMQTAIERAGANLSPASILATTQPTETVSASSKLGGETSILGRRDLAAKTTQARSPASEVGASSASTSVSSSVSGDGRVGARAGATNAKVLFCNPPIAGINFCNRSLSGSDYKKYSQKIMTDRAFIASIEKDGIMISNLNGVLVTKPKQVIDLYRDDGKALIYESSR